MTETNRTLWRGIRNAAGDAGVEVIQPTAADLNVTAALSAVDNAVLDAIAAAVAGNNDDAVKGILRSLGDAGTSPTNATGKTLLELLRLLAVNPQQQQGTLTDIVLQAESIQNTTTTIHTVTSGKTLYLKDCWMGALNLNASTRAVSLFVTNSSDVLQYDLFHRLLVSQSGADNARVFNPPIAIASGFKIKGTSADTNTFLSTGFSGWEV